MVWSSLSTGPVCLGHCHWLSRRVTHGRVGTGVSSWPTGQGPFASQRIAQRARRPAAPMRRRSLTDLISDGGGNGVESRPMSLEAVIAMSLICGVIVAAIGYDRGRGLR